MNCKNISIDVQMPHGKALGDCWSVINYFINLGLERDEIIRLALWYPKGESVKRVDKLSEVLSLFADDHMVQLGEWAPTVPKIHWTMGYRYPFAPTKKVWRLNNSKKICYQFDGKSHGAKNFPSKEMEDEILSYAEKSGFICVRLGNNYTLAECVDVISECEFFIGIDSGMCHLAASSGIPIIFAKNNRDRSVWDTNHCNKHFILRDGYIGIIDSIDRYKNEGLDYYVKNAENLQFFRDGITNDTDKE